MKVAVITGASSGIGEHLAIALAKQGYAVGLLARREESLKKLCTDILADGGSARHFAGDVSDHQSLQQAMDYFETELGPIDLVIANAGVGYPLPMAKFKSLEARRMIDVNLTGVLNTVTAVLPRFVERKKGHLVAISSLASFLVAPKTSIYGASKTAVNGLMDSLWMEANQYGIDVTTICPGYIKTPLTARNNYPMPFIMDVEPAVDRILQGIAAKKRQVVFPRRLYLIIKMLRLLPMTWQRAILAKAG